MNQLTSFSMKNVAAMMILVILLVMGGSYAATTLKVESMPDISFPFVAIHTTYPAPPQDVMEQVTKPIEQAVSGLSGILNIVSTSADHFSQVLIQIEQSKKPEDFKKDIEAALANIRLPQNANAPRVFTEGFSSGPVYLLSVYSHKEVSSQELNELFTQVMEPGFLSVNGIDHLDVIGAEEAVLSIRLNAAKLNEYGLNPSQVANLIRASLAASPAGAIDLEGHTQMVRVKGNLDTIKQLETLKLPGPLGLVDLKEIGEIQSITESRFVTRMDGKPAIGVHLYKTRSANEVEFSAGVDNLIESWKTTLPDVAVKTVFNGASEIKKSIYGMMQEGILGAILASIMILLFLRNIRMTSIVLVSIPLSLLVSLLMMSWLDISLNIMTLGGLAISIGRVVDDSIVVIENIYTHLQKLHERNESVIKYATKQVSSAITSSTLTTVAVFAPIAFVSGIVGEVFVPFALTLVCALLASLLVALTVIPMLAKLLVMRSKSLKQHDGRPGRITTAYRQTLVWSLNHWVVTLLVATLMFGASIFFIVPKLPVAFMPESESDRSLIFEVSLPREHTLEATNAAMLEVENMLRQQEDMKGQPKFTFIESLVGYAWGEEQVAYRANLITEVSEHTDANTALREYQEKIANLLPSGSKVGGQIITFGPPNDNGSLLSYSLKSDDPDKLKQASAIIKEKMMQFPELTDIKDSLADSKKEIEISVDQEKAIQYGLTGIQVIQEVNSWIGQQQLGPLKFDGIHYRTVVELAQEDKDHLDKIGSLQLNTPMGISVATSEIAQISLVDAPNTINREMQQQVIRITAKIESADKKGTSDKISAALNELSLPLGVSREVKGVSDDIDKSFGEMFIAMAASVIIVYLVMVLAFGNASAPFAILFSLPLAVIGGLLGLLLTGESVNVTSLIGFLMLIGIVVTNAIVFIDRVQQIRSEGREVREALVEAGMSRLRPIIMTAGATIATLLPLAFGLSKGALISKGLAVVVIGGLTTSTLLTLVIVPIIYERNEKVKIWISRLFRKQSRSAVADTGAKKKVKLARS